MECFYYTSSTLHRVNYSNACCTSSAKWTGRYGLRSCAITAQFTVHMELVAAAATQLPRPNLARSVVS